MRLAVFTHVVHYVAKSGLQAYSPYVREINIWSENFEEVEIIAPLDQSQTITPILIPYKSEKLWLSRVPKLNFLNFSKGLNSIIKIPHILRKMIVAMGKADHIHIRCPGNIGLLACFVQIFFRKKNKTAKFAGNWDPEALQPWTYRLQKWILANSFLTDNIQVLVYGNWEGQTKNVKPFFTASFSESEVNNFSKNLKAAFHFMFAGVLLQGKNPMLPILLINELIKKNFPVHLEIYGDGILREELLNYIQKNNIETAVTFKGNRNLAELKAAYQNSHFLVLASNSEGWPKAVAEAMFFGCIPIATPVSCVPWMLGSGKRGILTPPAPEGGAETKEWIEKVVINIETMINDPEQMRRMSLEAQEWSQQYTLERLQEEIKKLLDWKQKPKKNSFFSQGRGEDLG